MIKKHNTEKRKAEKRKGTKQRPKQPMNLGQAPA
jgi:hypothetical protein